MATTTTVRMYDLVIPSGQQFSAIIDSPAQIGDSAAFSLTCPSGDAARTYRWQGSNGPIVKEPNNVTIVNPTDWVDIKDGVPFENILIPGPGGGAVYAMITAFALLRIAADANVASNTTFRLAKNAVAGD